MRCDRESGRQLSGPCVCCRPRIRGSSGPIGVGSCQSGSVRRVVAGNVDATMAQGIDQPPVANASPATVLSDLAVADTEDNFWINPLSFRRLYATRYASARSISRWSCLVHSDRTTCSRNLLKSRFSVRNPAVWTSVMSAG